MQTSRPAKKERTSFGQRLHALREQAGLSQQQLAERLGLTQRAYAHLERNPVALRPDQLLNLDQTLNVSVEDLVGTNGTKKRGSGPTAKMRQLFEAASRLLRSQQQKITARLEPSLPITLNGKDWPLREPWFTV
jgi:transcriptional regulator with XRE-family HTH domain